MTGEFLDSPELKSVKEIEEEKIAFKFEKQNTSETKEFKRGEGIKFGGFAEERKEEKIEYLGSDLIDSREIETYKTWAETYKREFLGKKVHGFLEVEVRLPKNKIEQKAKDFSERGIGSSQEENWDNAIKQLIYEKIYF